MIDLHISFYLECFPCSLTQIRQKILEEWRRRGKELAASPKILKRRKRSSIMRGRLRKVEEELSLRGHVNTLSPLKKEELEKGADKKVDVDIVGDSYYLELDSCHLDKTENLDWLRRLSTTLTKTLGIV